MDIDSRSDVSDDIILMDVIKRKRKSNPNHEKDNQFRYLKKANEKQYLEVKCTLPNEDARNFIPEDLWSFLSTTPYKKTVFYNQTEKAYGQFYAVDILESEVDTYGNVRLLVNWNKMEAGVSRKPFYVNYHEVCWQNELGRRQDAKGITKSNRTRLPTVTWIKEDSNMTVYKTKMNNFKKLMVHSGPNKGKGTTRLHTICDSMYNHSIKWKDDFIVENHFLLYLHDIIHCLIGYSLINPDYVKFQKMDNITCQQAIRYQKCLHETMLKSSSVTFLLLRNTMELYQKDFPLKPINRKRKSKVTTENQCLLSEGLYCQKDQDCNICKRGILTKKVQPLETKHCGMGLFASEDINENEYIIEYTGPIY